MESGDAYGVIIFPKDFTYNVYQKGLDPVANKSLDTKIRVKLNKTNVSVAGAIKEAVGECSVEDVDYDGCSSRCQHRLKRRHLRRECQLQRLLLAGHRDIHVVHRHLHRDYSSIRGSAYLGLAYETAVTPLRPSEFVVGYAIAYAVVGLLQTASALAFMSTYSESRVTAVCLAFLVVGVLAVMSLSLGMVLSSLAKRSEQAMASIPVVAIPAMLLTGIFWPVEADTHVAEARDVAHPEHLRHRCGARRDAAWLGNRTNLARPSRLGRLHGCLPGPVSGFSEPREGLRSCLSECADSCWRFYVYPLHSSSRRVWEKGREGSS